MSNNFPDPPDYSTADLNMLTARELREALEDLWSWIDKAEIAREEEAPPDQVIRDARSVMAKIIAERVDRHSDEGRQRTAE